MKKLLYFSTVALFLLMSANVFGQQKELDKLRGYIKKGKMEKAQAYCDKVTASLSEKKAARFYGYLGRGYYNQKEFDKAAEAILQSEDKKTAEKLAKEFAGSDDDLAGKLYSKAEKYNEAAALLFKAKKYEEAAKTSASVDSNMKYGDILFDEGKIDEAMHFYMRAKHKGKPFTNEKVLDYYYKKKDYNTAYKIQSYREGAFSMHVQGGVISKMMELGESEEFIKKFVASKGLSTNSQHEVMMEAYLAANQPEKAEAYCMQMPKGFQKLGLAFLGDKAAVYQLLQVSAWANYKLGKAYLAKNNLTNYLIMEAVKLNEKLSGSGADKSLVASFVKETKPHVEKCSKDYCEMVKHAEKMSLSGSTDLIKNGKCSAEDCSTAGGFLKSVREGNCK